MSGTIYLVDKDGEGVGSLQGVNGAASVTQTGQASVSSDREMGALASRVSDTWTQEEDVTRIIITAVGTVGESCVICLDAPDDSTAVEWLTGNTASGEPTMRKLVEVGQPREFELAKPLRRIDAKDFVGTVTNLFIEAGK